MGAVPRGRRPIPIKPLASGSRIYLETSAWNRIAGRPDEDRLLRAIHRKKLSIFTSVYAAGELLCTSEVSRRQHLCRVATRTLDEGVPLLDHPRYLLRYAIKAWRRGESEVCLSESRGARRLRLLLENPDRSEPLNQAQIVAWIRKGAQADHRRFLEGLAPSGPRLGPPFCSQELLTSNLWNRTFANADPHVKENGLSFEDVLAICDSSDIWKAYRSMVAFTVDAGLDRMPETRPGLGRGRTQKRPGGPDIRQAIYLGVCDTFVLTDGWFQESLERIASAACLERQVVPTHEFLKLLSSASAG